MRTRQILSWCFLALSLALIVFHEPLNTAFDSWRMRGCERIKNLDAYDLKANPVTGDIWGISYDSLFQFDGRKWQFYKVPSLKEGYVIDAFIVFDSHGRLWQGGWDGASIFDGEQWTTYRQEAWGLPDTAVTSIAFEPDGKPWVGLSPTGASPEGTCGGVSILDGGRWMTYRFGKSSTIGIGCLGVQAIQFDASGNPWIGLSNGVVLPLEQAVDEVSQSALPGGPAFSSTRKSTGYFLIPEDAFPAEDVRGPVVLDDFSIKSPRSHPFLQGFSTNPIRSILFDEQGSVWILAGETLYRYRDRIVLPVRSPVTKLVKDLHGNLWAVGRGVSMYDGKKWLTYDTGDSCIGNEDVGAIAFDKSNRAWVSRFPYSADGISISTFDRPPPRVSDVLLRLRALFLPPGNSWPRWVGPILLAGTWLLILLGAKWPAFTFPVLTMILALASERTLTAQYYSIFVFEWITLFSLGGGLVHVIKNQKGEEGFWKNAAPGFYGAVIGLMFYFIVSVLWLRFGPSS
jgi:hypothetical protein